MNLQRISAAAAGLVLAASAVACGSIFSSDDDGAPLSYAPPAYYQVVNNVEECYYISSMSEAYALENAGLCPRYAIPTQMPLSWEETWWDYWSSPAYYNTYVPASYRKTYVSVTCVHFHQTYSTQITKLSKSAVYKASNGTTVRGTTVTKISGFSSNRSTPRVVNYSVPRQTVRYSSYRSH